MLTRKCRACGLIEKSMDDTTSKYNIGDAVMVAMENPAGNPRTPRYIRGKRGVIGLVHGILENIRDHRGIHNPLYTVKFDLSEAIDLSRYGHDLGRCARGVAE